jgi:hypothetical protein
MDATINGAFSNVIAGNAVSSDEFLTRIRERTNIWNGVALTPNASGELVFDYTPKDPPATLFTVP